MKTFLCAKRQDFQTMSFPHNCDNGTTSNNNNGNSNKVDL